jgi:topoisomerase-4 subunit B
MPVDIHPEEKIPGVELILTRLHAGGKFSNKNYTFSGGLHGVGVSVVNALSKLVEVHIKRDGSEYRMSFKDGDRASPLEVVGSVGKKNTGTRVRFWPDPKYFDTPKFNLRGTAHLLRAKAVLCPGLTVPCSTRPAASATSGITKTACATTSRASWPTASSPAAAGAVRRRAEEGHRDRGLGGGLDAEGELVQESYVNLIPTAQHGTHVNGLRSGLTDALREFCDFRNLLPRGVKLAPEDVWDRSLRAVAEDDRPAVQRPDQGTLSSRQAAGFVEGAAHDAFQPVAEPARGTRREDRAARDRTRQRALKTEKQVVRKKVTQGPALPGKLADCIRQDLSRTELFLVEGDSAGGSARQARDKDFQAILPLRGKILNTWEVASGQVLASQEVHNLAVAIGCDPGKDDDRRPALRQGGDPGRRRLRRPAHRHPALRAVPAHFPALVRPATCSWRCRRCSASTWASRCSTRWTRKRSASLLEP